MRLNVVCKFTSVLLMQVSLAFFEKRKTQRWSLIGGKQEERLYWEQWSASYTYPSVFHSAVKSF